MTHPPTGNWVAFPPPEMQAAAPPPAEQQAAIPPAQPEPAPLLVPPPLYPYPPYPAYPAGPLIDQLKAELSGVAQVTAGLREETKQLVRRAILLYLSYALTINQTMPDAARAPFRRELLKLIQAVGRDIRSDVWESLTRALFYGHQTASSYIPGGTQQDLPDPVNLQWLAQIADATQARLQASLESAVAYASHGPVGRFEDLMASVAPVQAAVEKLDRDIRWATNAAYNQAQRALADAHGMPRMWVAERDACLHCLALSGQIAQPGRPFDGGLTYYIGPLGDPKPLAVYPPGPLWGPPRHPNCVPAGTVVSGPATQVGYRRWYTGELVEIRTEAGNVLSVTPNHPVLTPQGWVPAGEVVPSAHVIRDLGGPSGVGRPDEDQQPAPIEQVFGALRVALGVSAVRMALAPEDFHGDGSDGEVEVVAALGFLQDRLQGSSGDPIPARHLFETRPGQVAFDTVIEVRRFPYSGRVYNLQTAGGWYTANGIVTHNCRCYQIPVPVLEGYPVMPWESGPVHPSEALQREARRSVAKGMSGSDSLPARLRATSALLAVGAGLPKSVEAKARAAVRARRYR